MPEVVEVRDRLEFEDVARVEVVELGAPGPRGSTLSAYRHSQGVASAVWVIDHGLGYRPNVTVLDSSGREVVGELDYPSDTRVIVTFAAPFGGEAYLS